MGDTMNLTKSLSLALSLAVSAGASAMSKTPPPDPIADFQNSWAGQALAHQRSLDVDAPMSKNNILGTHNTYNSEVYRTPVRYIDPQQKHSISISCALVLVSLSWMCIGLLRPTGPPGPGDRTCCYVTLVLVPLWGTCMLAVV